MTDNPNARLEILLEAIEDNQKRQLEWQSEALSLQKEQFQLLQEQHQRAIKLQDRAEALQEKSAVMMEKGRKLLAIILPIIIGLIVYLSWLLFR